MNKKLLLTSLLSLTLLASCGGGSEGSSIISSSTTPSISTSGTSSNVTSSEVVSSGTSQNTSSEEISSESSSEEDSSVEIIPTDMSVGQIKLKALDLLPQANEYNCFVSEDYARVEGTILGYFDVQTTKKGYGDRYKIMIANGDDYLYVQTDYDTYNYIKTYDVHTGKNHVGESVEVVGRIGLYCGEPELVLHSIDSIEPLENLNLNFESKTIPELYDDIDKIEFNIKGCGLSSLARVEARLLAKMDDSVFLFHNGNSILSVHLDDKIGKNMIVGKTYELYGVKNIFKFRPGLHLLDFQEIVNEEGILPLDPTSFNLVDEAIYQFTAEKDSLEKNPGYFNTFKAPLQFRGYVSTYFIDNTGYYIVLDNSFIGEHANEESLADNKSFKIKNESCNTIKTSQDLTHCPLYDYIGQEIEVKLTLIPYETYTYNKKKIWKVYVLEDSIEPAIK